jgi:hypothetical protein
MTYSLQIGKYKIIFSDSNFKPYRKKPTISIYDSDKNCETKIASFNSQDTFEWFIHNCVMPYVAERSDKECRDINP